MRAPFTFSLSASTAPARGSSKPHTQNQRQACEAVNAKKKQARRGLLKPMLSLSLSLSLSYFACTPNAQRRRHGCRTARRAKTSARASSRECEYQDLLELLLNRRAHRALQEPHGSEALRRATAGPVAFDDGDAGCGRRAGSLQTSNFCFLPLWQTWTCTSPRRSTVKKKGSLASPSGRSNVL